MYSQLVNIGIAFQNSYGVDSYNVDSLHFIPFVSEDLGINKPPLISQNQRGIFDEGKHYEGANMVDGSITSEAEAIPLGVMLATVMDLTSSTTLETGVYQHVFKPRVGDWGSNSAQRPVTIYKEYESGSADILYDMNGNNLELNIQEGALLSAKVEFVGGSNAGLAPIASTYPAGRAFTWDVSSVSLSGSANADINALTITLSENLEAKHTFNAKKTPSRIKRAGFRTVEVSGTLKFENQDEYDQFKSQSEREMILTLTNDTEISSGYYEVLEIVLPSFRHTEFKPNASGPGEIEVAISAKGVYNVGSGTSLQATLTNTIATY